MKIINHIIEGESIRIVTTNPDRPDFVYPIDKFKSLEELKKEINKSIKNEKMRKDMKQARIDKLEAELNAGN